MEELAPDVVVSTHWATDYYAEHMKNKPFTVMYGPDAHLNPFFCYKCDLDMISVPSGYEKAMKLGRRFNEDNLKLVPTAIRKEAFDIAKTDKRELRKKLGISDRFTVIVMDGGYGVGLTEKLSLALIKDGLPINVIAACGKNDALAERLKAAKGGGQTELIPLAFCENILEYIAASDLYFGKSGSGIAEPSFFGVPSGITHSANEIEKLIADHYIKSVGIAARTGTIKACKRLIEDAYRGGDRYKALCENAKNLQPFGADGIADTIFAALDKKFGLTENTDE